MKIYRVLAAIASLLIVIPLHAVELPEPSFHLWSGDLRGIPSTSLGNLLSLDIYDGSPGLELLGSADSMRFSARDVNNKIRATVIRSFVVSDATGLNRLFTAAVAPRVVSGSFPDPTLAQFQCGGANVTRYRVDNRAVGCPSPTFPNCPGFLCFAPADFADRFPDDALSVGIANANGQRLLVIGKQVYGSYINNVDGEVDIDAFSVTVYTLDGQRVWTRSFPILSNGYEITPELSGVAAFSGGDDELRVASVRGLKNSVSFRYRSYDMATGDALGSAIDVSAPLP